MIGEITAALAQKRGLSLDAKAAERFTRFFDMLSEANSRFNLTRIEEAGDAAEKHFLDSLSPLWLCGIENGARCIDVGAGAGFPCVPLAIARPDLRITALDSVGKKIGFINEAAAELGLDITAVHARAEDLGREARYRESFDAAFSRAVAPMNILLELSLPLLRVGGIFYAWKGPGAAEELAQAQAARLALGGSESRALDYGLMDETIARKLIIIDKIRQTPPKYPRMPAKIRSNPLSS